MDGRVMQNGHCFVQQSIEPRYFEEKKRPSDEDRQRAQEADRMPYGDVLTLLGSESAYETARSRFGFPPPIGRNLRTRVLWFRKSQVEAWLIEVRTLAAQVLRRG